LNDIAGSNPADENTNRENYRNEVEGPLSRQITIAATTTTTQKTPPQDMRLDSATEAVRSFCCHTS